VQGFPVPSMWLNPAGLALSYPAQRLEIALGLRLIDPSQRAAARRHLVTVKESLYPGVPRAPTRCS
jgi:hypothetical protein